MATIICYSIKINADIDKLSLKKKKINSLEIKYSD